jgi:uncharacterized protein (DUF433 family)
MPKAPEQHPLDPAGVVVSDPGIAGGAPIFRGTRVPVARLLAHLEDGMDLAEILAAFPTLDPDDVRTVLLEAGRDERLEAALLDGLASGDAAPLDTAEWAAIEADAAGHAGGCDADRPTSAGAPTSSR